MTTDPLTTTLAQIQDRVTRRDSDLSQCAAADLTRLLGAVKAVLAVADEWATLAPPDDWGETPQATALADAGRMLRAKASAALLGEESADG